MALPEIAADATTATTDGHAADFQLNAATRFHDADMLPSCG
jgi:hypothetical protein